MIKSRFFKKNKRFFSWLNKFIRKVFLISAFFSIAVILFINEKKIIDFNKIGWYTKYISKIVDELLKMGKSIISFFIGENNINIFFEQLKTKKDMFTVNFLVAGALTSSVFSQLLLQYIIKQETKIFGINPKPFAKYYTNIRKFQITLLLIFFSYIFEAKITLSFVFIGFIFYTLNLFLIHDFTRKLKDSIKNGFFIHIKKKKKQQKKFYNLFIGTKTKSLHNSCEELLPSLIVYSMLSGENKNIVESYNSINYNLEIIKDFYNNHLQAETLDFFIEELKKSINAFFIAENSNPDIFQYYFDELLDIVFSCDKPEYETYNITILISIISIILETKKNANLNKKEYMLLLQEKIALKLSNCYNKTILIIYIILFWELTLGKDIIDKYIQLNNALHTVKNIDTFTNQELKEVYDICIHIIKTILKYSDKFIDDFNKQYLLILNYVGQNLYQCYYRYEEEVR